MALTSPVVQTYYQFNETAFSPLVNRLHKKVISYNFTIAMFKRVLICFLIFLLKHSYAYNFEINLTKQLSKGRLARNFVYSPIAIRQALGLLYLSKDNVTDQQLESALQLTGLNQEEIISLFREAREKVAQEQFTMGNRIYLSPDYNASPNITQLSENLGVEVKNMTFSGDQSAASEIKKWLNKWIGKAGGNLFGKNDISQTTQIVAVQGMSYSCVWKNRETALTNRTFTLLRQNKKPFVYTTQMMYTEAPMDFFNNDQVRGVMVPFKNSDMGMLVLLPRPRYSTQQILYSLDTILKIKLRRSKKTHLFLPKFKVSESVDLNMALKALGIQNLFTNTNAANFKQYNSFDADQNRVLSKLASDVRHAKQKKIIDQNYNFSDYRCGR